MDEKWKNYIDNLLNFNVCTQHNIKMTCHKQALHHLYVLPSSTTFRNVLLFGGICGVNYQMFIFLYTITQFVTQFGNLNN